MGILFLCLAGLMLLFIGLILCMAIDIRGRLFAQKDALHGSVRIRTFGGLFTHTFSLPPTWSWPKRKKKRPKKKTKQWIQLFRRIWNSLDEFTFRIRVEIGTHDAAQTALLCGGITALLQAVGQGVLPKGKSGDGWQGIAVPVFDRPCLDAKMECIIRCRLVHIIGAAIRWQVQSMKERT